MTTADHVSGSAKNVEFAGISPISTYFLHSFQAFRVLAVGGGLLVAANATTKKIIEKWKIVLAIGQIWGIFKVYGSVIRLTAMVKTRVLRCLYTD